MHTFESLSSNCVSDDHSKISTKGKVDSSIQGSLIFLVIILFLQGEIGYNCLNNKELAIRMHTLPFLLENKRVLVSFSPGHFYLEHWSFLSQPEEQVASE